MAAHAVLFVYLAFAEFVSANWLIAVFCQESEKPVGKFYFMNNATSIDFLIRIKNGYMSGRKTISAPVSKFIISIADLMKKYGYIGEYSVEGNVKKTATFNLLYENNLPKISDIQIFSKPSRRIYEKSFSLPWGKSKSSLIIISTSAGLMSQKEAKSKGLGGEIIAEIY